MTVAQGQVLYLNGIIRRRPVLAVIHGRHFHLIMIAHLNRLLFLIEDLLLKLQWAIFNYFRGRVVFIVNTDIPAEWIIFFEKRVLFEWVRDR
jgi:hypothetical protein